MIVYGFTSAPRARVCVRAYPRARAAEGQRKGEIQSPDLYTYTVPVGLLVCLHLACVLHQTFFKQCRIKLLGFN